jgi:hypothetical protein
MEKAIALSRAAIALLPTSLSALALATVMPWDSLHWNASPHPPVRGFRRAAKSLLPSVIFAEPSVEPDVCRPRLRRRPKMLAEYL